jgi:hypothetical protein
MKLLSIIFFIYWIFYTFIGNDIIMNTILNKKIKYKDIKNKDFYKNIIRLTNINFLIIAWYFNNRSNESYFIAIVFSLIAAIGFFIFFFKNNYTSKLDHIIPFIILLLYQKNNMEVKFTYLTHLMIGFILLYIFQYKKIYNFN